MAILRLFTCYMSVQHILYSTRASFMTKLQELLQGDFENFESVENVEELSFVLDSELWENKFDGLLSLIKEYIVNVLEIRKQIIRCDSGSGLQLHSHS